jgi:ankyrin repeat protein
MHHLPARVRLLIEHGVDVNAASPRNGRTPYEEALRAGNAAMARYLQEHGARTVDLDPLDTFALACVAGRRDVVEARLAQDPALLGKLGAHGRAELIHRAVSARQPDGVRLIAQLGVDLNAMIPNTGCDRAPLHNAAGFGSLEMVTLLIELGADPHLRDLTHRAAPIGWANYGQQREIVEYLLRFASIFDAVRCGGVERVAELLAQDTSLATASDENGDPVLFHLNPESPRLSEMLDLLTAHGADLNARDSKGRTLLDRAVAGEATTLANELRARG